MLHEDDIQKWMNEIAANKNSKKKLVFDQETKKLILVEANDPRAQENLEFTAEDATRFGAEIVKPVANIQSPAALRKWWHSILSKPGHYSCYAIFLMLPSDKNAIRYVTKFGAELDLLSGENCLLLALSDTEFKISGFDKKEWENAISEQTQKGYIIKIADLFEIKYSEFPCVLFFQDIRLADHVTLSLKGMTTEEIATNMRSIFSFIQEATNEKKNPINAIWSQRNGESFIRKGKTIIGELRALAGRTFETAVATWLGTIIK